MGFQFDGPIVARMPAADTNSVLPGHAAAYVDLGGAKFHVPGDLGAGWARAHAISTERAARTLEGQERSAREPVIVRMEMDQLTFACRRAGAIAIQTIIFMRRPLQTRRRRTQR